MRAQGSRQKHKTPSTFYGLSWCRLSLLFGTRCGAIPRTHLFLVLPCTSAKFSRRRFSAYRRSRINRVYPTARRETRAPTPPAVTYRVQSFEQRDNVFACRVIRAGEAPWQTDLIQKIGCGFFVARISSCYESIKQCRPKAAGSRIIGCRLGALYGQIGKPTVGCRITGM